jgi:hypothetical protein
MRTFIVSTLLLASVGVFAQEKPTEPVALQAQVSALSEQVKGMSAAIADLQKALGNALTTLLANENSQKQKQAYLNLMQQQANTCPAEATFVAVGVVKDEQVVMCGATIDRGKQKK